MKQLTYQKPYVVASTRLESKEIVSLELLDESSVPTAVKTCLLRISVADYENLGAPTVGSKLEVTLTLIKATAPTQS